MTKFIFLHGGPGLKDYLQPYFKSLGDQFTCVFYDQLRGPKITIEDLVKQLDDHINSAKEKVVLVGHSWGGVLAMQYASLHQENLAGLVLMSTGLNFSQWTDKFHKELERLGLTEAPAEKIFLTESELELGKPFLDATWESFSSETFDQLYETYLKTYDLTEQIKKFHIPILNIYGEFDVRFPKTVAKSAKSLNGKILDFEVLGAGHFPFLLKQNRKKITDLLRRSFPD